MANESGLQYTGGVYKMCIIEWDLTYPSLIGRHWSSSSTKWGREREKKEKTEKKEKEVC